MKFSWQSFTLPALVIGVAAMVAPERAHAQAAIKIDGSSTVFPIAEAFAEEFQIQKRGKVRVTVGVSGTGGGFKKFCRGETDMANASRPISVEEMENCRKAGIKYIELPIAFDALTVVVNPANTWAKTLTVAELKKMWEPAAQGRITTWNQINPKFPKERLMLFGPGADSGTFDYFTEAVNNRAKASRGDYTASEDDNTLVQGVENNKTAIGYFGYAYYAAHKDKMTAVAIDAGKGKGPVLPSFENVTNATYSPLSRPLFVYVRESSAKRPEVGEFVRFMTQNGQLVKEVGFLPLPPQAYELAWKHFKDGRVGSVFAGHAKIGITIDELLALDAKL
jgi:phosphate transport system substrate-binding protein